MKKELKGKLPNWYKDIDGTDIILTGDIDSLMGYYLLKRKFNVEVGGFYDFNRIYRVNDDFENCIGIDMDTVSGYTIGNHITHFYKNKDAINLNNYCKIDKYYKKYSLSTAILICSLYDFDLESMTDEQLKILLAIDTGFKGYYTDFFKPHYLKWLDRLDYKFLEDRILKQYTDDELYQVIVDYRLNKPITVNGEGFLHTDIRLDKISEVFDGIIELPTDKFHLHRCYDYQIINPMYQVIPPKNKIISMAWTKKNELKLTLK